MAPAVLTQPGPQLSFRYSRDPQAQHADDDLDDPWPRIQREPTQRPAKRHGAKRQGGTRVAAGNPETREERDVQAGGVLEQGSAKDDAQDAVERAQR
jgi:hypothetical protein